MDESLNLRKKIQNFPDISAKPQKNVQSAERIQKKALEIQMPESVVVRYLKKNRENLNLSVPSSLNSRTHMLNPNANSPKKQEKKKSNTLNFQLPGLLHRFVDNLRKISIYRSVKKLKNFHYSIINDLSYYHQLTNLSRENFLIWISNWILYSKFLKCLPKIIRKLSFSPIYPTGYFRVIFDILMMINTIFYFVMIPLRLSFKIDFWHEFFASDAQAINLFVFVSFFLFFFDIFLNFNTSYYEKGELIQSRLEISKNYLKNNFFKDIISLIYIFYRSIKPSEITSEWEILSIFYFLRYQNLNKSFHRIEEFLFLDQSHANIFSLVKLIFRVLLLCHFLACIWHYIGYINSNKEITWLLDQGILDSCWTVRYIESLYFVAVVTNTVGFGDITPVNIQEKAFCIVFIYITCGVFAYTINSVGMILRNINKLKQDYKDHLNNLNGYLQHKKIDHSLRMKLKHYLDYIYYEEKLNAYEDSQQILQKLSNALKEELLLNANGIHLRSVPVFTKNFSEKTLRKITNEMKETNVVPGEIIYNQSQTNDFTFYILKKGEINLFIESSNEKLTSMKTILPGQTFGEYSFFTNMARETSAKSTTFSSFFEIKLEEFIKIIKENEEDFENYCLIKDKIVMKNDFAPINLNCFSCNGSTHLSIDCPLLSINVSKVQTISKWLFSKEQERRNYLRRKRKKINSVKISKKIQSLSNLFFNDGEESEENDSEKTHSQENSLEEIQFLNRNNIYLENDESEDSVENINLHGFDTIKNYNIYYPTDNFENKYKKVEKPRASYQNISATHHEIINIKKQVKTSKNLIHGQSFFKINNDIMESHNKIEHGPKKEKGTSYFLKEKWSKLKNFCRKILKFKK